MLRRKSDALEHTPRPGRECRTDAEVELLTNHRYVDPFLSPWTSSKHSALNVGRRYLCLVVTSLRRSTTRCRHSLLIWKSSPVQQVL